MANEDFDNLSFQEQEAKRNAMFQAFRSGNLKDEDTLLFIDQFSKGQIILNKENDDLEKMAGLIGQVEKENASDWKISHGRLNKNIKASRNLKEWGLRRRVNKLLNKYEQNRLQQLNLEKKFLGPSKELAQIYRDKSLFWATQTVNNRFVPRFVGNLAERYYDNKARNALNDPANKLKTNISLREATIKALEKDVAGSSIFNAGKWGARIKLGYNRLRQRQNENALIGKLRVNELAEQRQKLETRIKQAKENLSNAGTKATQKQWMSELRELEGMVSKIDARSVKLRHVYDERRKTLDDKFTQSSDILRNEIKNRSNIIDTKNQLLERTTFRGKAMEKLLNGLPEGRRKSLEEIVNSRYQENVTADSEFVSYLESKGFNQEQISIIRGEFNEEKKEKAPDEASKDKKEEESQAEEQQRQDVLREEEKQDEEKRKQAQTEKNGQVNDGESDTPPADNNAWHEKSQENLDDSFRDYQKIEPQREGKNSDNENVLYASYEHPADGHAVTVEKANADTYDVAAKDKDGSEQTPSVEDMKNVLQSLKKDGHDKMEMGNVNTPEFYAHTVIAAKECGLEITNAKEMAEQMKQQFGEDWKEKLPPQTREAFEKATTPVINDIQRSRETTEQETAGTEPKKQEEPSAETTPKTENQQETGQRTTAENLAATAEFRGNNDAIKKMDLLVRISDMNEAQFDEFQKSNDYKKLSAEQRSLANGLHKLKNNKEFASKGEREQAILVGRLVGRYKSSVERETQMGKNVRTAKRDFVKNNMSQYIPSNGGR